MGQALLYFNCELVPLLNAVAQVDSNGGPASRPAQPAERSTVQDGADDGSATAKAASLRTGVSPDARIADRVFGQGPDAAALAPVAALGGNR